MHCMQFKGDRADLVRLVDSLGRCMVNVWEDEIRVYFDKPVITPRILQRYRARQTPKPTIACLSDVVLSVPYLAARDVERYISERRPLLWRVTGIKSRKFSTKTALSHPILERVQVYLAQQRMGTGDWRFTHGRQKLDAPNHTGVWRLRPAPTDWLHVWWTPK